MNTKNNSQGEARPTQRKGAVSSFIRTGQKKKKKDKKKKKE